MGKVAILLTIVLCAQLIASFYQVTYYQRFMKQLVASYQDKVGYQLVSEVVKYRMSSHILAVVLTSENNIAEAYFLKGMTVFSRFKPCVEIVGYPLDESLLLKLDKSKQSTIIVAIQQLIKKYT